MSNYYNYENIICPNCGRIQNVRFTVKTVPFGQTTIASEGVIKCLNCKEYYMPTVKTIYDSRKLSDLELKRIRRKNNE